jgi:hypothetical protein
MKVVKLNERDTYLRTKSRFYITGWLDAERNEPAQASTRANDEEFYSEYLTGYKESMSNQFSMDSM